MKKIINKLLLIWKDPVWSKVISAAIIGLSLWVWAQYSIYSANDIYTFFINILSFKIPIFLILSIAALILIYFNINAAK